MSKLKISIHPCNYKSCISFHLTYISLFLRYLFNLTLQCLRKIRVLYKSYIFYLYFSKILEKIGARLKEEKKNGSLPISSLIALVFRQCLKKITDLSCNISVYNAVKISEYIKTYENFNHAVCVVYPHATSCATTTTAGIVLSVFNNIPGPRDGALYRPDLSAFI